MADPPPIPPNEGQKPLALAYYNDTPPKPDEEESEYEDEGNSLFYFYQPI